LVGQPGRAREGAEMYVMNQTLRDGLTASYEREKGVDGWGVEDAELALSKLAEVQNGEALVHPGEDIEDESKLVAHAFCYLSVEYYGIAAFAFVNEDRLLTFDQAEAAGVDGTGRDQDPRFPYTWGNLTTEERAKLLDAAVKV
jgi:hypothetical protein